MSCSARIVSSFGPYTEASEVVKGVDLTGVKAIITGAVGGIGVETARALVQAGAEVTIAARRAQEGQQVAEELTKEAEGKGGKAHFAYLDLQHLETLRAFAKGWGRAPLHILINNAAVMACPLTRTKEGFELQLGTNHMGHFLLTDLLLTSLQRGAQGRGKPSRVVSLSSIGHRFSSIQWQDINYDKKPYDKWEAYGQAKTANSLFAVGLHQRYSCQGVVANAVMPGPIMTALQRHMSQEELEQLGWVDAEGKVNGRFKTPSQGASTSVWAAVGPELEGVGGLYLEDCAQAKPWQNDDPWHGVMPHAVDVCEALRFWDWSADRLGIKPLIAT